MTITVEINRDDCAQCGNCYEDECPEVFMEDEDGTSEIVEKYRDGSSDKGKVPDDLLECVKRAVASCAVDAITISQE